MSETAALGCPTRRQPDGRDEATWQIDSDLRLAFPGSPAGFSCVRSRKLPRMPGGQRDAGLAELVAQAVGGRQRIFPALLAAAFQQIDLFGLRFE